jgi:PAS domain S-box-containing protein
VCHQQGKLRRGSPPGTRSLLESGNPKYRTGKKSGEMKSTPRLNRSVQFAFGSAILTLLVVGAVSYRGIVASSESDRWVQHTHEVLESLADLRNATRSIESSSRGFVLTGRESYLESYRASITREEQDQLTVRGLTVDNPAQQRQLSILARLAAERIQFSEMVIGLRRSQGLEAAADAIRTGPGQRIMDELQGTVRQMQDEELRLLEQRNADAKRRLARTKAVLIFGTVLGLLITAVAGWSVQHDTSRRERAEEMLRDSEEKYRTLLSRDLSESKESGEKYRGLLEAAPDAMVVVNPAGDIVLLNVQAEKQFGYRRDELVGQKVKNIIPEGFAERLIADGTRTAAEALAQQMGNGLELYARRKNGSDFPIEIMLSPLESAEGILVTAAIRDISVRKAAEKHLAQMEGRYRGLLEAAPDAMVVVNPGGDIVLLNVQAENKFGYSRDELVGQKMKSIIPEGFAERLIADALRTAEDALAQQIGTGIELTGRRKDGSDFPIEIMLSPLESAEGILVTAAIRDITTRKRAEAHLLQKVAELNRSNEELGQFAYIASHDLQEPLRMVASYTQLLSRRYKGKLDADGDQFIAFAVDGANRMQRLIQDLLAFSRVGTKGQDLLDISSEDALLQALMNLRSAIEESGAQVTHDPLPPVLADETQLVQLFQNLVGNAIKYQSPGVPRVHVSAASNGAKKWLFSVKDNGLGIDPQYFDKIFGMFQRLHKREEFAGTGIGLAICKKIVERHGGSISVESQPGQGSTFRFALAGSERKTMKASGG